MSNKDAQDCNERGVASFQRGEFAFALDLFSEAARLDSENAEYSNNIGMCRLQSGAPAKARPHFERALELRELPLYHLNLGITLLQLGNPSAAEAAFRGAIGLDENYFEAWFQLGLLYYSTANRDGAWDAWSRAAEIRRDATVESNLGMVEMERDNTLEARKRFKSSIRLNERYAQAHFNFGVLEQREKKFSKAAERYEKVTRLEPKSFAAWMNLGIVRTEVGDMAGARDALERFLKVVPPGMETQIRDARRRLKKLREADATS